MRTRDGCPGGLASGSPASNPPASREFREAGRRAGVRRPCELNRMTLCKRHAPKSPGGSWPPSRSWSRSAGSGSRWVTSWSSRGRGCTTPRRSARSWRSGRGTRRSTRPSTGWARSSWSAGRCSSRSWSRSSSRLLCYHDTGLDSPFRWYYLLSLLCCAIRYRPAIAWLTFGLHGLSFGVLAIVSGEGSEAASAWPLTVVMLAWVTWASSSLASMLKGAGSRPRAAQRRARGAIAPSSSVASPSGPTRSGPRRPG